MNKLNKFILTALCLTLIIAVGYRMYAYVFTFAPKPLPLPLPTPTIDTELRLRADRELSPKAISRAVVLKNKLRDRDAFMRECQTLTREQLLQTLEDLARIAGDCEAELKDR